MPQDCAQVDVPYGQDALEDIMSCLRGLASVRTCLEYRIVLTFCFAHGKGGEGEHESENPSHCTRAGGDAA